MSNTDQRPSETLESVVGKTIKAIEFVYDAGGYQNLVIQLDDGTWIHAWENGQAGEMIMRVNATEIEPEEFTQSGKVTLRDTSACIPPELVNKFANVVREIVSKPAVEPKCSPSWHLDAWLFYREEYHDALGKDLSKMTPEEEDNHMILLDEMLKELDKRGTIVNRMFGSSMVEGEWNKSKDDDKDELPE